MTEINAAVAIMRDIAEQVQKLLPADRKLEFVHDDGSDPTVDVYGATAHDLWNRYVCSISLSNMNDKLCFALHKRPDDKVTLFDVRDPDSIPRLVQCVVEYINKPLPAWFPSGYMMR